jgi:hypothetical protein
MMQGYETRVRKKGMKQNVCNTFVPFSLPNLVAAEGDAPHHRALRLQEDVGLRCGKSGVE